MKAAFFLCRSAAVALQEQGSGGSLVLFSSQGWWTGGFGGSVVYSSSKGGVTTMARGLARTYAPHGIGVNCVAPGLAETSMLTAGIDPGLLSQLVAATPLGRLGSPEEMVGPAIFLSGDHARFITGATLNVSGGFLMY